MEDAYKAGTSSLQARESTITAMAREYKVGRWTLTRALKKAGTT